MRWVVMRLDLTSALTDDNGIMIWNDFEIAQKAAVNFGGIVTTLEESYRVMAKMASKKE